jgi:hypothetical protein
VQPVTATFAQTYRHPDGSSCRSAACPRHASCWPGGAETTTPGLRAFLLVARACWSPGRTETVGNNAHLSNTQRHASLDNLVTRPHW